MPSAAFVRLSIARRWLRAVKLTAVQILYTVGVLQLLVAVRFRRQALVLTYHRVLSNQAVGETWSHQGMVVRTETFESHLQWLTRWFRVLTAEEFVEHLEEGTPFQRPCCLITFDDGWRDTFEEAWPALQRHRVPAVVFLPVDVIGTDRAFWQEHLSHQLHAAWRRCRSGSERTPDYTAILPSRLCHVLEVAPDRIRGVIQQTVESLKNDPAGLDPWAIVRALEANGTAGVPMVDRLMSWNEVRAMAAGGIAFGGHGATHRILTSIPAADVVQEVEDSRRRIEVELRDKPLVFSYPNGNWNSNVADVVRRAGYRAAFSTELGPAAVQADRFSVHRVNVHENAASSPSLLLATIAGIV